MPQIKTDPAFIEKLNGHDEAVSAKLQQFRELVHDIAAALPKGPTLVETLKWGELSFLTEKPRTGTTIRISENKRGGLSMYVSCNSQVIDIYRERFAGELECVGNREVILPSDLSANNNKIARHIAVALNYQNEQKARAK